MSVLGPRWEPLRHHDTQQAYWRSPHRFNVVPAGRRSGKTELAKRKVVKHALRGRNGIYPARYFAAAPTFGQAKRIFWDDLKDLTPDSLTLDVSETDKIIKTPKSEIHVLGMDKPERFEGSPWDGGVLDEYANMRPETWGEHVRPALSDRLGWCDLIGVPEGRNHYYGSWTEALAQVAALGRKSEWGAFHWKSAEILPASEIEAARRDLDELTFQQEYEASFVNFVGQAYYPFRLATHTAPLEYDKTQPLVIALDFNVSPGVAAVGQEMDLPSGEEGTGWIGEVYIPRNSNTPAVCKKLIADWGEHEGRVEVYGDATGGARGTAQVAGSDWDIVRRILGGHFRDVHFRIHQKNPAERARINAVNSRLKAGDGSVRMMVDPKACPNLVKDFEGVRLLEGGSGEIDKRKDPMLTHLTDAVGYYVEHEFPIRSRKAVPFTFRV